MTASPKVFSFLAFQVFSFLAFGQPTAPPLQDPLISLMASQPRLDITSVVTATAAFDPPVVGPDELSVYRVTFNALEQSIEWPEPGEKREDGRKKVSSLLSPISSL